MKPIVYAIAFVFSLFAVYSHFIMDNWHLPFVFIAVSFLAFYNFRLSTLSKVVKNRVFVCLIVFYVFYFFSMTFSFDDFYIDAWSLKKIKIEIISIFILITTFILIMGQKSSSILFHYFYSFISITFFLSLICHFTDFNSIYNKNFYGYHAFLFLFYFNIKNIKNDKLFFIVSIIILAITFFSFNSRTSTAAILIYLFIYRFYNYFFNSGIKIFLVSIAYFFIIFFSIYYYTFEAIDNDTILELNSSGEKGVFGRLGIWVELLQYISNKPWFGYGSNISSEYMYSKVIGRNLSAHNTYLDILFRIGIIGFLLVVLLFSQLIKYFHINKKSDFAASGMALLFSSLFMAAGYEFIFFTILSVNFFLWCGIAFLVNKFELTNTTITNNINYNL